MKKGYKKHIGLIILLFIVLVFPTSLNYQARLNMRIIVTGLAVDKDGEDYKVTAQYVKTSPGNESPGTSAEIDFIVDKAETLSEAISKLAYKAGKVAAFSHTNFIILGKSLFEEDVTKCLDYFIRDKIIKNSALLLFAPDKAEDEIKKTKNMELSVGLGLQKVFLFKENESDGLMVTLIDFLRQNKMYAKSAVASELAFHTHEESSKGGEQGSSSSESSSSQNSSGGSSSESGSSSGGSSSSSSGGSEGSTKSEQQYFDQEAPLVCFVDGKFVGKIEDESAIDGYMMANKESKIIDVVLDGVSTGRLQGDKIEVVINRKSNKFKVRFENQTPVIDVKVKITKAEIIEIMSNEIIASLTNEEFESVKNALAKKVSENVAKCFENSKKLNLDVFSAYEIAYKKHNKKTTQNFNSPKEFLEKLKLNVIVDVVQIDY